jgi:predicted PurR-regulated permease PerM
MMAVIRGFDASLRSVLRIVMVVAAVLITAYIVYLLRKPISWLVIALFIAVAVSGPVALLSRRMPRGLAIACVYMALVAVPALLVALLVPPLVGQAEELVNNVPRYAQDVTEFVNDNETLANLNEDYDLTGKLEEEAAKLPEQVGAATKTLSDIGVGLISSIFALVTILILSIFMVSGGSRWIDRFLATQDPDSAERLRRAFEHISTAIGGYVGGALLQATIAGVMAFVVLSILGAPFAGALALIMAFGDLIPVVGATIAAVLIGVVLLFVNFPVALIIWSVYAIVYQQVENYVIQPQIQRRAVAVEPFVILVAVLFGSTLFGVLGALLAIPAAASIQIAVREWLDYRRALSRHAGGPQDPTPPAAPGPGPPSPIVSPGTT